MPEQSANAGPGSEYPRVGWGPSGLYKDGQKISDAPLGEALAVNAAALDGPGSPLTETELARLERTAREIGVLPETPSLDLIAEIRRLRAQVAELSDQKQREADYVLNYVPRSAAVMAARQAEARGRREGEKPLAWTKEPPTVPGWYWCQYDEVAMLAHVASPTEAYNPDGSLAGNPINMTCQWAGPIRPPS